ncbi:MAG: RNA 2',3'-cyclic phosphodiesterase [Marmoricola sp.]
MFVAAVPPESAVEDLDAFLDARREHGAFRWTLPEHWHVTLAFLADVPDRAVDELAERLAASALRHAATTATILGGGAFPHVAAAKVLWAGLEVDDADGLAHLAAGCRTAAAKAGAEPHGQRFRPHLTLARMSQPVEATRWVRLLDAYRGPSWRVEEVALIASHLGEGPRRRPRYETVARFPLGA